MTSVRLIWQINSRKLKLKFKSCNKMLQYKEMLSQQIRKSKKMIMSKRLKNLKLNWNPFRMRRSKNSTKRNCHSKCSSPLFLCILYSCSLITCFKQLYKSIYHWQKSNFCRFDLPKIGDLNAKSELEKEESKLPEDYERLMLEL